MPWQRGESDNQLTISRIVGKPERYYNEDDIKPFVCYDILLPNLSRQIITGLYFS